MTGKSESAITIRVGVSACLLGQKVRFDGQHKQDLYLKDILGAYFQFVAVCPEIEVGMKVPREAVRLVGDPEAPRMIGNQSGEDWTDRMNDYSQKRVKKLEEDFLSGYILKKDSPSCGMERVKIYNEKGMAERNGVGLYARTLLKHFPLLPVEEEGRLHDARLRENFIVRVFAYHRLQNLFREKWSRGDLVSFHTIHKLLLMAHSPEHYRQLGRLVAKATQLPPSELCTKYSELFMQGLKFKSTAKKNVNVMLHIIGHLREYLEAEDKRDLLRVIEEYHQELVPLIVPITLLRHYIYKYKIDYIRDQIYLNPHPKELMLRNHV